MTARVRLSRCLSHRARLSPQAAASCGVRPGTLVAVKVRHPGVEALMAQDFVLMARAARLAGGWKRV